MFSELITSDRTSTRNTYGKRKCVTGITIHNAINSRTNATATDVADWFDMEKCKGSSNYIISDNEIVGYVPEEYAPYTSDSYANDTRCITMELCNDGLAPDYHVSDKTIQNAIKLCADICKRYGIKTLVYTGDSNGSLTRHDMFANTNCPAKYLGSQFTYIAAEVNKLIAPIETKSDSDVIYRVQTGAYTIRSNADAQLDRVKKAGFDAFVTKVDGMYKVQIGAYSIKENAINQLQKVKKAGFDAFITTVGGSAVEEEKKVEEPQLKVGSQIILKAGAKDLNSNRLFASFVYSATYEVLRIEGNNVVFGKCGVATGVVSKDNVIVHI